jgi:hypothetical protein
MGLLSWLRGSPGSQPADDGARIAETMRALGLRSDGSFPLACVGESHYQSAFERICGPRTADGERGREVVASLRLEDDNPYDPHAVRVDVQGTTVGYLSRPDALAYRQLLASSSAQLQAAYFRAQIRGGWHRSSRDEGSYGIWLAFPLYGPPKAR